MMGDTPTGRIFRGRHLTETETSGVAMVGKGYYRSNRNLGDGRGRRPAGFEDQEM